jgi:hypothetical protein
VGTIGLPLILHQQKTTFRILDNPIDEEDNPIDGEDNPIDEEDNPIDEEESSIGKEDDPIGKEDDPIDEEDSSIDEEESPIGKEESPIDKEDNPIDRPSIKNPPHSKKVERVCRNYLVVQGFILRQHRPEPVVAFGASTPASGHRRSAELPSCPRAYRACVYPASPHQWTNCPESYCRPPTPSPNNPPPHDSPPNIAS